MNSDDIFDDRRGSIRLDMEQAKLSISYQSGAKHITNEVICLDFAKGGILFNYHDSIPLSTPIAAKYVNHASEEISFRASVGRIEKLPDGTCNIALHLDNEEERL